MSILNIEDPYEDNNNRKKHEVIGIDFGTTNSLASFVKDVPFIIPNKTKDLLTKSIFEFEGLELKSIKRLLGKSYDSINESDILDDNYKDIIFNVDGKIKLKIGDNLLSPLEVASKILLDIKGYASDYLNKDLNGCVISVPAYFDDIAKGEVKKAARLAGLEVLRMISEPSAACYAYGLDKKNEAIYLVYDFGGGTFDVSIVEMKMGVFRVLCTGGDSLLGGDDIDILLRKYFNKLGVPISLEIAKSIKEQLSYKDIVSYNDVTITQGEFNELIRPIIMKTINITNNLLDEANLSNLPIGIVMVGGSSRIPLIEKELQDSLELPIFNDHDPDLLVGLGVGQVAYNLSSGNKDNLIIDSVPLSLGIEVEGGLFERIIDKNTPIPCSATKIYTTGLDNQNAMKFNILQGERELAKDCRSIGFFELRDIEQTKSGLSKIEVTFIVDMDNMLSVSVKDLSNGIFKEIEILPEYGISESEILEMLKESYNNLESDHKSRLFIELSSKANRLCDFVGETIELHKNDYSNSLINEAKQVIVNIKTSIKNNNLEYLQEQTNKIKDISKVLVDIRLEKDIVTNIKGKNIKEI